MKERFKINRLVNVYFTDVQGTTALLHMYNDWATPEVHVALWYTYYQTNSIRAVAIVQKYRTFNDISWCVTYIIVLCMWNEISQ